MLDNIKLAFSSLLANKMRSLLTMLGIIIGIGSVIAIETVGNSLSGSISSSMSSFGASNITVSLTQKSSSGSNSGDVRIRMFMRANPSEEDLMTDEMVEEYRAAFPENVKNILLTQSVGSFSRTGYSDSDLTINATVTGVNDEYAEGSEIDLLFGRWINNEKDEDRRVCVVSDQFAEKALGLIPLQAVGQSFSMTLSGMPYTFYILGVYEQEKESASTTQVTRISTEIYLPMSTARTIARSHGGYQSFTVVTADGTDVTKFLEVTGDYFESYYTRNNTWTAEASSMQSMLETITEMMGTISMAIAAVAAISLLVGGIGVMNIMMVSISERTKEIGTRKALGAPGSAIRLQFIVEAMVICLIGGVIGVAAGVGLGAVGAHLLGYEARPSLEVIAIAVGFSMAIGVFFGYYPANKAAKMDPIEALRYE